MKILLLLSCLSFMGCLGQKLTCPFGEDIKPCICKLGMDKRPQAICEDLKSAAALKKAMTGMRDHQFSSFYILKSNIGVLPADTFADVEMRMLTIKLSNLTSLSESVNRPPLLGQEKSLEYLEIKDSFVDDAAPLTRLSISHLKKLVLLQLENNIIPTIGNGWFESGPYSLRELYLMDTRCDTLGSHVFASLKNLRKVAMTGGHISQITREMFPSPALFLESINFSNNKIETLPAKVFYKLPSLTEIFLENNALKTINEVVFAPVWSQMNHAYFYGNPLVCDQEMKWIYKYRLPQSFQGYCVAPRNLLYRPLTNLTLSDFEEKKPVESQSFILF